MMSSLHAFKDTSSGLFHVKLEDAHIREYIIFALTFNQKRKLFFTVLTGKRKKFKFRSFAHEGKVEILHFFRPIQGQSLMFEVFSSYEHPGLLDR
jgi:hypothetical protein